jgi:hypothetical protein
LTRRAGSAVAQYEHDDAWSLVKMYLRESVRVPVLYITSDQLIHRYSFPSLSPYFINSKPVLINQNIIVMDTIKAVADKVTGNANAGVTDSAAVSDMTVTVTVTLPSDGHP